MKGTDSEKEGINVLENDLKCRLATLRKAESLKKKRWKRECVRAAFFPYKFAFSTMYQH